MTTKLFTSLAILFISVTAAFADFFDGFYYELYGNGVKITWYDGANTHVDIPATLGGKNVLRISGGAFADKDNLSSVTIPNTVISIGDGAFYLSGLTTVTIPAKVTTIEEDVFGECFKLTTINVDASNTTYTSVEGVLFNKAKTYLLCYPSGKETENYTIPSTVTKIYDDSFVGAQFLKSVTIPQSVTTMAVWEDDENPCNFVNCPQLMTINVDAKNKYFSSIDGVLFNKSATKIIAYPSGRGDREYTIPTTVTTIAEESFTGAGVLEEVIVPGSVTLIETYAMDLCTSLDKIIFTGRPPTLQAYEEDGEVYYSYYFPNIWNNDTKIYAYAGNGWDNLDIFGDLPVVVIPQIASLTIAGDDEISANGQSVYEADAIYTDATAVPVKPIWSIVSGELYASVDGEGVVTASNVTTKQTISLKATYTDGGITKSSTKNIAILPIALTGLRINGVGAVVSGQQATYTATALFSNGSEAEVTPSWSIKSGSAYASVSTEGVLRATDEIYVQQDAVILASYEYYAVTKTAEKSITISAKAPKITMMELITEATTILAGKSSQITARVIDNVGGNKIVTPTWSVLSGTALVNVTNGKVVVASDLHEPSVVTVGASYTENGVTITGSIDLAVMPIVYSDNLFEYTFILKQGWQLIPILLNLTADSELALQRDFIIFFYDTMRDCYSVPRELNPGMSCWLFVEEPMIYTVRGTPVGVKLP